MSVAHRETGPPQNPLVGPLTIAEPLNTVV